MDVFIPEEYVVRRRIERKVAASAGNGNRDSSSSVGSGSESAGRRIDIKEKKVRVGAGQALRLENSDHITVSTGVGSDINVVFSCFSA
jgi:hypothetical protein